MIILHKQNASVVTFLSFVFSCPSFPFLPPTLPCRKGFVPRSDERPPTPNPPLHSQPFRAEGTGREDLIPVWRTGFSHSSLGSCRERPCECSRLASSWNSMEAQLSKAQLRQGLPCGGAVRDGAGWLPAPRLCPCAGNGIQDTPERCAKQDWCCHSWHSPSLQCQGVLITHPESKGGQRPSGV